MKRLGMVKKLSLVLCGCWICFPAQACTIGSVSESLLQMSSQYRSQTQPVLMCAVIEVIAFSSVVVIYVTNMAAAL